MFDESSGGNDPGGHDDGEWFRQAFAQAFKDAAMRMIALLEELRAIGARRAHVRDAAKKRRGSAARKRRHLARARR
jgi:hypothetical protein